MRVAPPTRNPALLARSSRFRLDLGLWRHRPCVGGFDGKFRQLCFRLIKVSDKNRNQGHGAKLLDLGLPCTVLSGLGATYVVGRRGV